MTNKNEGQEMKLKTHVTYTLSYEDIFNLKHIEHIISDDLKLDSVTTWLANVPSPANKVTVTRFVNLYEDIKGDWKRITVTPTDSFCFYVSDKLPTLENITNALNKESDGCVGWEYIDLPEQSKKVVVSNVLVSRNWQCAWNGYTHKADVIVRKLNKNDVVINTKGHEIWPQKTGNIPSQLANLFKKNIERLEFAQDHNINTK